MGCLVSSSPTPMLIIEWRRGSIRLLENGDWCSSLMKKNKIGISQTIQLFDGLTIAVSLAE
jgi:hypothetical protein